MIKAPWTLEQVKNLEDYQNNGKVHQFTGKDSKGKKVNLIPTVDGWIAEPNGIIIQNWCHHFMCNKSWK